MSSFVTLLQQGNSWWFVPSAILLGALHGLEPGHSKTMMAAFIVAIRGSVPQAVLLGLAATVSHTAVVWLVALGGLYFGRRWDTEASEPYLQVISAALIIAVALWMLWRMREYRRAADAADPEHEHHHHHDHDHAHHEVHLHADTRRIDTGHGFIDLQIFEAGVAPRFRIQTDGPMWLMPDEVRMETERSDGSREVFTFRRCGEYLESLQEVPEPHEFVARLHIEHDHHGHDYDVEFVECAHTHAISAYRSLDVTAPGYQDPHELAHANDIRQRFAGGEVTTGQIVIFGLTGGLIPCPASVTVLLLCLQLKKITLGATLILCFSIGLALTMVAAGTVAALGVQHARRRFAGFGALARNAPYVSGTVILLVGLYLGYRGLHALA
jgi:nickel/cobalt transporter (NicO) family protein